MRRPGPWFFKSLRAFSAFSTLLLISVAPSCYRAGDGIPPPLERVYFPVGLALTTGSKFLVVANSDFDLQYNAGSVGVLNVEQMLRFVPKPCEADGDCAAGQHCDVEATDEHVPSFFCVAKQGDPPCGDVGERSAGDRLILPGRCNYVDPQKQGLYTDKVEIGAFATDVIFRPRLSERLGVPGAGGRIFIPVRGDATLHWADLDDEGHISCGAEFANGACDDAHRAGDDPDQENTRDLRMAAEPYAVDVSPAGEAVLVSNQTSGTVSLFRNEWREGQASSVTLQFAVTNLPARPVGIVSVPEPAILRARISYLLAQRLNLDPESMEPLPPDFTAQLQLARDDAAPAFLVTFRNAPEIDLIRTFLDAESGIARPYAARAGAVPITIVASGADSRGIAVDPSLRALAEADCAAQVGKPPDCYFFPECVGSLSDEDEATYNTCLTTAAATPLDVYVASRAPASLLIGRTTPALNALLSSQLPAFYDTVPLTLGPSRVALGKVRVGTDTDGKAVLEPRVFLTCFDSRRIYIYDPKRHRIEMEVITGRGPYSMAIDAEHDLLYVGHFTDSFIGVVSLDQRFQRTYGKIIATIGEPTPPRASK